MAKERDDQQRYERYRRVLRAVLQRDEFSMADIKMVCAEQSAVFVTRVVQELEQDGLLDRLGPKSKPAFRWSRDRSAFADSAWIDSKIFRDQIPRAPKTERPRERLLALGAEKLKTAELLAILVRVGRAGESALQAGEKIAARYADQLEKLPDAGRGELQAISPVVAETAYCQIMAGIELGRRVTDAAGDKRHRVNRIRSTAEAMAYCQEQFRRLAEDKVQEEFHIVTLSTKNDVISTHQISVGLLDQSAVHPREVYRHAIRDAAKSVILVHNHPSGDPEPSDQDLKITRRLEAAGDTLGIQVLDHIIVARNGAVSLREHEA